MSEDTEDVDQIITRSGRSFGVGRPGDNGSFSVGPSELAALSGPTPAEEDGGAQSFRELDSALQDVEGPAPAELPVGGADPYITKATRHITFERYHL